MATSDPPVLNPTDVYSTDLPQNLRTTDPLISALANYTRGIQILFVNIVDIKAKSERADIGYTQLKDAALIEEMNEFLDKTVETSGFMTTLTLKFVKQNFELVLINARIFLENIRKIENVFNTDEVRLFGKLGILAEEAVKCITMESELM
ncbi:hypothetical protein FPQ18DRAFT_308588 [Pyronema domesticum]|nr:hypothetical protein FPQ18DRAFT_308588 [Pyronema domesticum]